MASYANFIIDHASERPAVQALFAYPLPEAPTLQQKTSRVLLEALANGAEIEYHAPAAQVMATVSLPQAANIEEFILCAECCGAHHGQEVENVAGAILGRNDLQGGDQPIDALLREVFNRYVYDAPPHIVDQTIDEVIAEKRTAQGMVAGGAQSTKNFLQKTIAVVSRILSNPAVAAALALYTAYRVYRLADELIKMVQLVWLPRLANKAINLLPVSVINYGTTLYGWRYHFLLALFIADVAYTPARRITRPIGRLAWQAFWLPIIGPIKLARATFTWCSTQTQNGAAAVNQQIHQWINAQQFAEMNEARNLWVAGAHQRMGI